jgi:hypothetical protein
MEILLRTMGTGVVVRVAAGNSALSEMKQISFHFM